MLEKSDECPICGERLSQAEYDMQYHGGHWSSLGLTAPTILHAHQSIIVRNHVSAARDAVRIARRYFNESRGWWLNQDQIDLCRDHAHMAQRDVRRHLEMAVRS